MQKSYHSPLVRAAEQCHGSGENSMTPVMAISEQLDGFRFAMMTGDTHRFPTEQLNWEHKYKQHVQHYS